MHRIDQVRVLIRVARNLLITEVNNNNEYDELGKNGRKMVKSKYSWKLVVRKVISIYNILIKNNS